MRKFVLVIILFVLLGCEKKDELPTALNVTQPPTPTNLQVVQPDTLLYNLTWDINDPNNLVKEYWVYAFYSMAMPETVGTTTDTAVSVPLPIEFPGLGFAVSAVTIENIESDFISALAPDTILTQTSYLR